MSPLKASLKRGALVAAANWHVVVVQLVADVLFKGLVAVPIAGGMFLVVLLVGGDPQELLSRPYPEILPAMAAALLGQPIALACFLIAIGLTLAGGSVLMFLAKGGTVTVLVAGEQAAGAIEHAPLRLTVFRRAAQFTLERFTSGAQRLFRRYLTLGVWLMIVYLASTAASLMFVFRPSTADSPVSLVGVIASLVLVAWITVVNFIYLLFQIVIGADDCSVRQAAGRVVTLLKTQTRTIGLAFGAILILVLLATAASILATAALGLIAFVPFVGLAALPLQLIAWVVRGAVFQYIGLSALVAYLRIYRMSRANGQIGKWVSG